MWNSRAGLASMCADASAQIGPDLDQRICERFAASLEWGARGRIWPTEFPGSSGGAQDDSAGLRLFLFADQVFRLSQRFLRRLISFRRVFHGLPRMLVPGHVIFFTMVRRRRAMRVRRHFVKFRRSLVQVPWHLLVSRTSKIRCRSASAPMRPSRMISAEQGSRSRASYSMHRSMGE